MATIDDDLEWISVSELSKRIGKTPQTCYNYVREGRYPVRNFRRGNMNGILVGVAKEG